MGSTFVAAGRWSPDEILSAVDHGLYVRRMEAASVDRTCGRAVFRVTDSDRIRNGKTERPLGSLLLQVDGPKALDSMTRIGNDLEFDRCIGTCQREGQPLAISVGAPTICIGLARVSG